jgi:hypothetical protein
VLALIVVTGCTAADRDDVQRERLFELGGYMHPEEFEATTLRRVDPETFLPAGRPLRLGDSITTRVVSPDRSTIAFGGVNFGEIIFVDPETLQRRVLRVTRERFRTLFVLSWPRRDKLIAASCRGTGKYGCFEERLWILDPTGHRPPRSLRLPSLPDVGYDPATRRTFGLVAGFKGRIRSSWLLVVEPDGAVRRIALPPLEGGVDARRPLGSHYVHPSLALDSRRRIAVVVGPYAPVAEIDLRTLRVRYHRVRGLDPTDRDIARERTREWTGTHNPNSSSTRRASVVRPGLVLVEVAESRLVARLRVRELGRRVLLDADTWRARPPQGMLERAQRAGPVWLANTRPATRKEFPPFRLVAYDDRARVVYRIDGRRDRLFTWRVGAGLLYAGRLDGSVTHVFDLSTGKLLGKVPPREFDFNVEPAAFRLIA